MGIGAAEDPSVEHPRDDEIPGVFSLACYLLDPVNPGNILPDKV